MLPPPTEIQQAQSYSPLSAMFILSQADIKQLLNCDASRASGRNKDDVVTGKKF